MTNPNNIVRVRARNGGRASVYEANGWCQAFSTGLLEGNGVIQNTSADMNVLVGGSATKPDVLIAQNPAGYKIALDVVGQQAVAITAPASNKRVSAIVAYTNDLSLSTTQNTVTGSPASCGLIVVNGSAAANPSAPTDTQIRNAITADGATGSQAAYCVVATITVPSGTTVITDNLIQVNRAALGADKIDFATSTQTLTFKNLGGDVIGTKTARMIPLDSNGLAMLCYRGGTGGMVTDNGLHEVLVDLGGIFSTILGAAINGWAAGDGSSYLAYNDINSNRRLDFYIQRIRSDGTLLELMVAMMVVGYTN